MNEQIRKTVTIEFVSYGDMQLRKHQRTGVLSKTKEGYRLENEAGSTEFPERLVELEDVKLV